MAARIPSRVLSTGQRLTATVSTPEIRVTEADVRDPATLHRVLSQMIVAHRETSRAHRASSRMRATVYEGLAFSSGSNLTIQHGYGTLVRYAPVRWVGSAVSNSCLYSEVTNDGTRLVLRANSSGTCDLEVWPV